MRPTFEVSNAGQRNGQTGESHSLEPIGRQTPDRVQTDVQALKIIDSRHEGLQAMPPGALDAVAARRAASSDEAVLNSFADKVLQGRAAAVMGDTADQHPTYKAALKEASPLYANLADRAYADDQQRLVAKEVRKALEFAGQRDEAERTGTETNSIRSERTTAQKRRAIPPLEDRFNVKRTGLVEKEYHFRDQAGKVAFTDKLMSISTGSESPAAIKAMVDRAAERGWETVRLNGSPEFVRQGWIAATAQGLKAVGHSATAGDREAAAKERARLQMSQDAPTPQRPSNAVARVQSVNVKQSSGERNAAELDRHRQLATAIEKALADGKVSPELRGRVRAMLTAEVAKRVARGERFKVPVYDSRAPRARSKPARTVAHRPGDRERSR